LPANDVLQRRIGHLLTRPVGRPPKRPIISFASFRYQAKGWTRPYRDATADNLERAGAQQQVVHQQQQAQQQADKDKKDE
jgi:hypothetical protein